jgi:hypothetical protein
MQDHLKSFSVVKHILPIFLQYFPAQKRITYGQGSGPISCVQETPEHTLFEDILTSDGIGK